MLATGLSLNSRFTLLRPLGKGGMGEVWLVRDRDLDDEVVAKIVPRNARDSSARDSSARDSSARDSSARDSSARDNGVALLQRECRNARRLMHPNIVRVFDFHHGDEHGFITMEYVDGDDLGRYLGRPPAELLRLVLPIVGALEYAHRLGVVHCDLKVSNVLCDAAGSPHLLDFGISRLIPPQGGKWTTAEPEATVAAEGGGSRYSMSPQQLDGEPPRPADDIYALGVLLYELTCGQPPFWPRITDDDIRSSPPPPLVSEHPLPDRLRSLITAMLAKSPDDRPPDMAAVRETLEEIQHELAAPSAPTARPRLAPPPRIGRPSVSAPPAASLLRQRPAAPASRDILRWATAAVFVVLTVAALGVFLVLPDWVEDRETTQGTTAGVAAPAEIATGVAATAHQAVATAASDPPGSSRGGRRRAQQALESVLRWQRLLAERNAALWGGEEYAAAEGWAETGDAAMRARDFGGAHEAYRQASRSFEKVAGTAPQALSEALAAGRRALAAGDAAAATAAFELATTISPGDAEAAAGSRRAAVLDRVVARIEAGDAHRRRGRLAQAAESYRAALALVPPEGGIRDPDVRAEEARRALARLDGRIAEDAFARVMSEGLAALEREDYAAAGRAFEQANGLRPGSPQSADGLAQAEEGLRLTTISELRRKAAALAAEERWREAAAQYDAVLALDSTVEFAQEGRAHSLERAEVSDRLGFHLANTHRLSAANVLEEAAALAARAAGLATPGSTLERNAAELVRWVEAFRTPVRAYLESDEQTEVMVYKVGRLGTFSRRALDLRPGTYTVVGSRLGYRDVRRQLVIAPGATPPPLSVRCQEEI